MNCAFALVTREAREFRIDVEEEEKYTWQESRETADSRFLGVFAIHRYTIPINTDYSILKLVLSSFHSDVLFYATISCVVPMQRLVCTQKPHAITTSECGDSDDDDGDGDTPIDDTISNKYLYLYVYYMHYMLVRPRNMRKSRPTYIFIIIINFN